MRHSTRSSDLPLSENRLEVANPHRLRGLLLLVFSAWVGLTVWGQRPAIIEAVENLQQFAAGSIAAQAYLTSAQTWSQLALLALVAGGAATALASCVRGLSMMLLFYVPVDAPHNLRRQDIYGLLRDRRISTYDEPVSLSHKIMSLCSDRLKYAMPWKRDAVEELGDSIGRFLKFTALIACLVFFQGAIGRAIGYEISLPVPTTLLLVMLSGLACSAGLVATMATYAPSANVSENRIQVDDSPHPMNLFHHLREALDELRYRSFRNREFASSAPEVGTKQREQVCNFDFDMGVETQPVPLPKWVQPAALLAGLASLLLGVFGFKHLVSHVPALVREMAEGVNQGSVISLVLVSATSIVALKWANYFAGKFAFLSNLFRFRSRVCHIRMEGTTAISHIGIGDGRGGTLHADRPVAQSSGYLILHATELITECCGLTGERYIVSAEADVRYSRSIQQIVIDALAQPDGSSRLPKIDLAAQGVSEVIQANRLIQAQTEFDKTAGAGKTLPGLQSLPELHSP